MVWKNEITSVSYGILWICKCTYTIDIVMLNCNKDTTEETRLDFVNDFLQVVLKMRPICLFIVFYNFLISDMS